jgi:periplasmic divalent cation tolerance protein
VLMVMKTLKSKLTALEKLIIANHPYQTPEFLVLPLKAGSQPYLDWLQTSLQ